MTRIMRKVRVIFMMRSDLISRIVIIGIIVVYTIIIIF